MWESGPEIRWRVARPRFGKQLISRDTLYYRKRFSSLALEGLTMQATGLQCTHRHRAEKVAVAHRGERCGARARPPPHAPRLNAFGSCAMGPEKKKSCPKPRQYRPVGWCPLGRVSHYFAVPPSFLPCFVNSSTFSHLFWHPTAGLSLSPLGWAGFHLSLLT